MKYKKAILRVAKELKADPEMFYGFQSNIAMRIVDEFKKSDVEISYEKLHRVANKAAINFLKALIN